MLTCDFAANGKTELLRAISARNANYARKVVSNRLQDVRTERFQVFMNPVCEFLVG